MEHRKPPGAVLWSLREPDGTTIVDAVLERYQLGYRLFLRNRAGDLIRAEYHRRRRALLEIAAARREQLIGDGWTLVE
jgi:hypothetical protein